MKSFNEFIKETKGFTKWYKSNRPIQRYEESGSKRISVSEFNKMESEYESIYGSYESQYRAKLSAQQN